MDIVERLLSPEVFLSHGQMISPVAYQAAYEIERLREALRWAAPCVKDDPRVSAIIKAALKEKE